ncbi:SRPBCC family protein [Halovenus salina]|uniref:SRPBCC family protein n=1 Tax=Halovenus salina TaxID=1510225 RepID=A0ABD5W497_9EURY|nr:SRPBCC family protein [Halovenus salina]
METVSLSRTFEASPETIRALVTDVGPFIEACGFDTVSVAEPMVHIENRVGLLSVELDLELVDEPGAVLAYEQREGIFETMTTRYELDEEPTTLTATTDFALDISLVGELLDATVIKRQRRKELSAQFDYLTDVTADRP